MPTTREIKPKTLQFLADGEVRSQQKISLALAGPTYFNLAQEQLAERRANGKPKFFGKCETASTYLKDEGLIEYPEEGYRRITPDGLREIDTQPADPAPTPEPSVPVAETYRGIRKKLEETLLEELRHINPTVFEQLVVDLISKMGYGTGEHVGRVGDGGIDGIVKDHRLGLYEVYIQTKRQRSNVSNTAINKFKDALKLQDARMGIFVATSGFSNRAREAAVSSATNPEEGFRIVGLIDGKQLARLLLEYNVFHG